MPLFLFMACSPFGQLLEIPILIYAMVMPAPERKNAENPALRMREWRRRLLFRIGLKFTAIAMKMVFWEREGVKIA